MDIDEALLDSYLIAQHPTLLRGIEKDIERWKKGKLRTYTHEEMWARLRARERNKKVIPG